MSRKLLIKDDFCPYHITARTNNKEPFPIELSIMWGILTSECLYQSIVSDLEIHALVLMPNHFHLLATTPADDLGKVMCRLMGHVSKQANLASGRSGHIFGGPYHWSLIQNRRYFGHALKYVYRNPVKGFLCTKAEDYPYSTLHGLVGRTHLPFPIYHSRSGFEPDVPMQDYSEFLQWLNRPFSNEIERTLQKKLRSKFFGNFIYETSRRQIPDFERLL